MSASYCFVLHGRCIAPRVRDSIFAEHQRPQVAAFMECVDFMQPRWPSRISTFNSIFCRSFRFGTAESVGGYRSVCPVACLRSHLCTVDPARMNRCIHPASCRPTSPLDSWSIEKIRAKVCCEWFGSLIKSGSRPAQSDVSTGLG